MTALVNVPKTRGLDRDLVYLLQLAKKHNLEPTLLYSALYHARKRGRGKCGKFLIETRTKNEGSCTYLFSPDGRSFAQAVIRDESVEKLKRLPSEFSGFFDAYEARHETSRFNGGGESAIRDLRLGTKGVAFKAHVVKKSEVRAVTSKDGNPLLVCSVTLSDGTGEIPLAIWNSEISTISEGDLVEVRGARVRSYRGEIQLSLNRKTGTLRVLEPAIRAGTPSLAN